MKKMLDLMEREPRICRAIGMIVFCFGIATLFGMLIYTAWLVAGAVCDWWGKVWY